jgi:hypothetical protein
VSDASLSPPRFSKSDEQDAMPEFRQRGHYFGRRESDLVYRRRLCA